MKPDDWQNAGFGVYVHWPFCAAKCPYCDFNSHVRSTVDQTQWADALISEIETTAARTGSRKVDSIFFGGGTPSLMTPQTVGKILDSIAKNWIVSNSIEVTLEANPTSVEATRFQGYATAGVNRISMGIQSLIDYDLKSLGRMHSAKEAREAFKIARKTFENVSFDLIYARQNQNLDAWGAELNEAIDMAVDHLSLYQLTIEQGTRFGDLYNRNKLRGLPTHDLSAQMYELTQSICDAKGLNGYEISNHAAPGAECKHNLIYWNYGDYAGIGPGAHGRVTIDGNKIATESPLSPETWLETVERSGTANFDTEVVAPVDQAAEYLMMSLRLNTGCDLERLNQISNGRLNQKNLNEFLISGHLVKNNNTLTASQDGKLLLNPILVRILDKDDV